jgi:hypothetical protein
MAIVKLQLDKESGRAEGGGRGEAKKFEVITKLYPTPPHSLNPVIKSNAI